MRLHFTYIIAGTLLLASCGGWTEDRKQIIIDKCDSEMYDCDCFLKTTMETFPEPDSYNETLEDEEANGDAIDAYYEKLSTSCLVE